MPSPGLAAPRELGPLAVAQLAAWRTYALKWHYYLTRRVTPADHRIPGVPQYHLCCAVCDTSVAVLSSEGMPFLFNTALILDGVTAHLRNVHRDVEGEVYDGKDPETSANPRGPGTGSSNDTDPS